MFSEVFVHRGGAMKENALKEGCCEGGLVRRGGVP